MQFDCTSVTKTHVKVKHRFILLTPKLEFQFLYKYLNLVLLDHITMCVEQGALHD